MAVLERVRGSRTAGWWLAAALGVLLVALMGYGLLGGRDSPPQVPVGSEQSGEAAGSTGHLPGDGSPGSSWSPIPVDPDSPVLAELPEKGDPAEYAAAVATVLFGMDHRTHRGGDYVALFSEARSPVAVELISDFTEAAFLDALGRRIPDDYMWQRMADSQQWATFAPERVWEPEYVAEKRADGELPAGVAGLNVAGTQTIHYLDEDGRPASRERGQSVSIVMACEPVHPACRLLAISSGAVE